MIVQLSKQHGHQKSDSIYSVVARSLPTKKGSGVVVGLTLVKLKDPQAGITIIDLCSPDWDYLKEALKAGGSTELDVMKVLKVKIKPINYCCIPTGLLVYILAKPEDHVFVTQPSELIQGQLRVNSSVYNIVGVGGFKIASVYSSHLPLHLPLALDLSHCTRLL
ncbi:hypothetical protein PAXRUDRAFT_158514 [Paxillus rubicundulus Ve08.2h10]|uniref:Uncharacterized protein n=1 Tax=Paxillus rubicundulus Ve08.2h10 TaxID=930991 RepID=A0A0D0CY44_9AGAM|nr:hypothetical protein PAXRUDRAFT_158514 [Paxillus rubicundulus Ve08.2h10]